MKNLINKATDIFINVKGEQKMLLSKEEIITFISKVHGVKHVTRSQSKKLTGLSYLAGVNSSAKIKKGLKEEFNTMVLYLQPYKTAFGNVCPKGAHCADACLNTSGRVKMDIHEFKILRSRYLKTILFYVNRDLFNAWLFDEIKAHSAKSSNFMVRLNGTSDLSPVMFKVNGRNVLETFKGVQFYDYSKVLNRTKLLKFKNYHLTFSYDGYNMDECKEAQKLGLNVSIVVNGEQPKMFEGKEVFSMDETDLRPLDEIKGAFGYLKLKETLNKDYDSKFVINL